MARRPGVRQSDLDLAEDAVRRFCAIGMNPRRILFGHQGGFSLDFVGNDNAPPASEADAFLDKFEAKNGDG